IAERKRRAEVEAEQRGRDQEREQIEKAVERSADSPVATVEPTEAQKAAGNYKKEHRSLDGHRISVENPKGSIRRGRDADGKEWQSEMHHDYGYFIGTKSTDGDNIDVFLSDNPAEGNVYVVDQYHPDGEFDEHKVMYGFNSEEEAMQAYLSNYEPGWEQTRRLDITGVNKDDFKAWLGESKRKRKPFADYKSVSSSDLAEDNKSITAPLSETETDEFGKPLVKASDGSTIFGIVEAESGLTEAPIRLSLGENKKDNNGKNTGYGLLHIEAGHGSQIRNAGYESVEAFVEDVARNYTTIREGAMIGDNQTYLLEISDGYNNTLFIQLSRDGKYWNVNSAGIFRKTYSRRKPKIHTIPAVGGGTVTDTPEVNSGQTKGATAPAGNSLRTSTGKDSALSSEKQEADDKPLSADDMRQLSADSAAPTKPKKAPANRVDVESLMSELSAKGEARMSDHVEPLKAEPEATYEISDTEMQSLADELRDLLDIGDDDGSATVKFRDPEGLTPQERQRIQLAGTRLAMALIERGAVDFKAYATKMTDLLGDKIRPWLKSFYEASRWTPGYEHHNFTPADEVARFDVQNFDKQLPDPFAQADMMVE
ncbi:MAG: hypothetical protein K2H61_10115, partial [Muribaculaceae bacterium]|nr:hypothetical protein [Muribaculaceae bacterium]